MRLTCPKCELRLEPIMIGSVPLWTCPTCNHTSRSEIGSEVVRYYTQHNETHEQKLKRVLING